MGECWGGEGGVGAFGMAGRRGGRYMFRGWGRGWGGMIGRGTSFGFARMRETAEGDDLLDCALGECREGRSRMDVDEGGDVVFGNFG